MLLEEAGTAMSEFDKIEMCIGTLVKAGLHTIAVKGIYGLPQAGILAQRQLIGHLAIHGYHQAEDTPCLFRHTSRNIAFTLVVDDFGVKHSTRADLEHLLTSLREVYTVKESKDGLKYIGIKIGFDRPNRSVSLSMPLYIEKALQRFDYMKTYQFKRSKSCQSPTIYVTPNYNTREQTARPLDVSEPMPEMVKYVQTVLGSLLYYARAIDSTILVAVNKIAACQTTPTANVMIALQQILDHLNDHRSVSITFKASDMKLIVHSDASFNSESKARSRTGGYFFFGSKNYSTKDKPNGAILATTSIIPVVVASAVEAEYGGLLYNTQLAEPIRKAAEFLGYSQTCTPIICDNKSAVGIAKNTVKPKRSKSFDLRFHWIKCRQTQKHIDVQWEPGSVNLADFFTKIHPLSLVSKSKKKPENGNCDGNFENGEHDR